MLDAWIDLARGPLLRLALLVMLLGLLRVIALQVYELVVAWRRAGDQYVPWRIVWRRLAGWIVPWRALRDGRRAPYSAASIVFHAGIILVPLFFAGHVAIWRSEFGVTLPAFSHATADVLSLAAVAALVWLLAARAANPARRHLSGLQDWMLPVGLLVCLGAGLLTSHPQLSPFDARAAYLVHLLTAEALLVFVPLSKLQHMALFWTTQASTELGWRFTPGAGMRVRATLGKEGQGV
ncbi:MAG: hypothetical protein KJ061_00465 [Vicinamibacteraceae bacterium]|nr:hypothetical protein [Vicinamibacteraceae bacterium]